jgi:hypothetical protein
MGARLGILPTDRLQRGVNETGVAPGGSYNGLGQHPVERNSIMHLTTGLGRLASVATVALLALAACSSGKSSDAAGGSSSSSASATSSSGARSGPAYAQCMRQHGVTNFPDPRGPNQNQFLITAGVQHNPHFQAASKACESLRPQQGTGGGATGGVSQQQLLAFAQCMRANGVPQFPDPAPNGALQMGGGLDPSSPQFQHAMQVCTAKTGLQLGGQ